MNCRPFFSSSTFCVNLVRPFIATEMSSDRTTSWTDLGGAGANFDNMRFAATTVELRNRTYQTTKHNVQNEHCTLPALIITH